MSNVFWPEKWFFSLVFMTIPTNYRQLREKNGEEKGKMKKRLDLFQNLWYDERESKTGRKRTIKSEKGCENVRRFLLLCMIFVMLLLPMGTLSVYADYSLPQYLRIGLLYGNSAPKTVTLEADNGFLLGEYEERTFQSVIRTGTKKVVIKTDDSGKVLVCNEAGEVLHSGDGSVGVRPDASGLAQIVTVNGSPYRGGIHCIKAGDQLTVVNVVFMDHYLYGVISREMSPSWPKEALKAQAVCARNYAANNLNKHKAQGFDLCSSVDCQAYDGTRVEAEGSYAPVDETTRQVLTYDGKLAQLYYSASMGPKTESVEYVWGNSLPYLVSVDNGFEDTENVPNGNWTGFLSCDEATAIMRNKGYDVGDVTEIKILERTPHDRVLKMEVVGTAGSKVFEREGCRTIFNSVTKSQWFQVRGDGESGAPNTIVVTDGTNTTSCAIHNLILLSSEGRKNAEGALCVTNGQNQATYQTAVEGSGKNTGFYFTGIGWGHGVGMSQYGAKGMAEAGYSYQDILLHYFTGTNLENAYGGN